MGHGIHQNQQPPHPMRLETAKKKSCTLYTKQKTEHYTELLVSDVVLCEEQHTDCEIIKILQAVAEKQTSRMHQYKVVEEKLYHRTHLMNGQIHFVCSQQFQANRPAALSFSPPKWPQRDL